MNIDLHAISGKCFCCHKKIEWARYKTTQSNVTLSTLTIWLYSLAEYVQNHQEPKKSSYYTGAKSEKSSTEVTVPNPENKCKICQRWKSVLDNKLCKICLRKHGGFCRARKECGVNGCSYKHHSLLHDDQRYTDKPKSSDDSQKKPVSSEFNANHMKVNERVLLRITSHELIIRFPYLQNVLFSEYENGLPGILIGSNNPRIGVPLQVVEGGEFEPVAYKTIIGWTIHGPTSEIHLEDFQIHNPQHLAECPCQQERDVTTIYINT